MSPRPSLTPKQRKGYSGKKISVFALNLQNRRKELGLSQTAVAEAVGVHPSQISQYEGGIFPTTPERIVALADALDCSCDDLLRPRNK